MKDWRWWALPTSLFCALSLACGASYAAAPAADVWSIESRRTAYELDGKTVLEIDVPVGNVQIGGADVETVSVSMVTQRHRDDPRREVVQEMHQDGTLVLTFGFTEVESPDAEPADEPAVETNDETSGEPGDWSRRRIDVGLQVPNDVDLVVRTDDGQIELKKLDGFAELSTTSGDIAVEGRGGLSARSEHGSIRALVRSTESDEPVTLESVNGSVWVLLLEGASATVELETSGQLTTDYSVEIERERGSHRKVGRAVVGDGRREIRLVTVNGQARLSSVTVDEKSQR